MNNLIIIGNGFDLAHNLKTSYNHFIRDLLDKKGKNQKLFVDLISDDIHPNVDTVLKNHHQYVRSAHPFFSHILFETTDKNWCDIEKSYFNHLDKTKNYNDLRALNGTFEIIKKYLIEYLIEEAKEEKVKPLESYKKFFEQFDSDNTLILNFNYTNTIGLYSLPQSKIINIHGNLNAKDNPIIFGFAADEGEISHLLEKDDNEFLRNIKRYNYTRTNNFPNLVDYIDNCEEIHIQMFGHSVGLSDKLILSEILKNKNIRSIRPYYFENFNSYFNIQANIDRITGNTKLFKRISTFPDSMRMPQYNDSEQQIKSFLNYTGELISVQKKELQKRHEQQNPFG